jgi:hypothetical protein
MHAQGVVKNYLAYARGSNPEKFGLEAGHP